MKKMSIIFATFALFLSCGQKPEADFSWSPEIPKAGQEVKFTNLSIDAKSYSWNFGDMSIGSDNQPTLFLFFYRTTVI